MLSHQNFADMKYGLDPSFRFTVSRAVYKGALKFLSNRYGCPYQVQPLPVHSFAAVLTDDGRKVRLSWKDTPDSLEATATVSGHILYTRVDDGAFDGGRLIETRREKGRICADIPIEKGHLYSFRIAACNDGGLSFPSETLAAGIPADLDQIKDNILIINNFYRTSPAAWFDAPERAGFDPDLDRGISDGMDISYIGRMFQFRRDLPWIDDDNPGFGASHTDEAGRQYAGNTFDYPAVHGRSWMKAGHPFCSVSEAAFSEDSLLWDRTWAADLICGKQVTTPVGRGAVPDRYTVFPARLQEALRAYSRRGGNLLVSGAHIGTDAWDRVYPVSTDSLARAAMQTFIVETLGYRWMTNYASRSPKIWKTGTGRMDLSAVPAPLYYQNEPGESCYHVETPDGLVPADPEKASTVLRYSDTDISAAVCYQGEGYKTVCFGFPLEVLTAEAARDGLTAAVSAWFRQPPVEPVPAKTPKRK